MTVGDRVRFTAEARSHRYDLRWRGDLGVGEVVRVVTWVNMAYVRFERQRGEPLVLPAPVDQLEMADQT